MIFTCRVCKSKDPCILSFKETGDAAAPTACPFVTPVMETPIWVSEKKARKITRRRTK